MKRLFALGLCACFSDAPPTITLDFPVDVSGQGETYTCYAFDAGSLDHRWVRSITWNAPPDGDVVMHHATLYAVADWPAGDVSTCFDMPAPASGLHVWVDGSDSLVMPDDMGLVMPSGTSKLVVQVHAIRTGTGPPTQGSVVIDTTSIEPPRVAAWMAMSAPIPALRPHMTDSSTWACTLAADVHVIRDWPHMHLAGHEFHGSALHQDGTTTALVDVVPWDFYRQVTYTLDMPLSAGDQIQTNCIWENDTDNYIFAGPKTTDEMCNQSLLVWPAASATWEGQCL